MSAWRRSLIGSLAAVVACLAGVGDVSGQQKANKWHANGEFRWMILASSLDADEAIAVGRYYSGLPHKVQVVRLANKRFATVVGPVNFPSALDFIRSLPDHYPVPEDTYRADGSTFVEAVWSPSDLKPIKLEFEGKEPRVLKHENLELKVQLASLGAAQVGVELVVLVDGNEVMRLVGTKENHTPEPTATAQIIRLDKASKFPQIVFSTFTGGAHCCFENKILTSNAAGEWSVVDGETLDYRYRFEDINGDGIFELISADETFLYKFSPYTDSHPPFRIQSLSASALETVTKLPAFRRFLRQDVFLREFSARLSSRADSSDGASWNSNGFLAGWVASKALVGELNDAWSRMLVTYDRVWDYKFLACAAHEISKDCPTKEVRKTLFPQALMSHLKNNGYGTPTQFQPEPKYQLAMAQAAFGKLNLSQKYELQMLLGVAGYWNAVSFDQMNLRLFEAVSKFQEDNGFPVSAISNAAQLQRLRELASPLLRAWDLVSIEHPITRTKLWVPRGLNLKAEFKDDVLNLNSRNSVASVMFTLVRQSDLEDAYTAMQRIVSKHGQITYKVSTNSFFVVFSDSTYLKTYSRFANTSSGVVGFTLFYAPADAVNGDRLATIMSDLYRANVELGRNIVPPLPVALPAPRYQPPSQPSPAPPSKEKTISQGTAFVVSRAGHFATNAHVVEKCPRALISIGGKSYTAQIVARDNGSDLALLKTDFAPSIVPPIRRTARSGEDIAVFGFPHFGTLSTDGVFTRGNITALSGPKNDQRFLQMQAPIHQGNSGGPMIDTAGNVTGVVTMKLLFVQKDLAQNLNFAVKGSVLAEFLDRQAIAFNEKQETSQLPGAELRDQAAKFTGLLLCQER